jgi:hypothetical protein
VIENFSWGGGNNVGSPELLCAATRRSRQARQGWAAACYRESVVGRLSCTVALTASMRSDPLSDIGRWGIALIRAQQVQSAACEKTFLYSPINPESNKKPRVPIEKDR